MTKEELERIKEAYYSGLQVQIWFDGYWKNFNARDYSMYSDPFSENRQYRVVGSAYADIAEKRIAELEEKISDLLSCKNCSENKGGLLCQKEYEGKCLSQKIQYIKELKEENAELRKRNGKLAGQNASLNRWLGEAIPFIKDYMIITIGDHTTVCSVPEENRCINVLKLNERAKSFLKELE